MGTQMTQQQICEECRGSGRVWRSVPRPDDPEYEEEETCRTCGGSGYLDVSEPDVRLCYDHVLGCPARRLDCRASPAGRLRR